MQKITPFLWFDGKAEEAVNFYVSVFKNSKIETVVRYGDAAAKASGMPAGSVMTMAFHIEGQKYVALNGGPYFKFTEAISFVVNCESQEEVDYYWTKLSEGGDKNAQRCGWLKDKYGVSWQIVPTILPKLLQGDPSKSKKVMEALLQMSKLDIRTLQRVRSIVKQLYATRPIAGQQLKGETNHAQS